LTKAKSSSILLPGYDGLQAYDGLPGYDRTGYDRPQNRN
jgi:hypothetical protein